MKNYVFAIMVGLMILLTGCQQEDTTLTELGLNDMSAKEILTKVGNGEIEVEGFALSVYDHELVVITEDDKIALTMPKDEFYLSVAPYENNTHTCTFHSATGCRGEMKSEEFLVEFVDDSGEVILSETMNSLSNGFIDLWLPRNVNGTLTITHGALSASKDISTLSGQPTCETTMQLQ